MASGETEETLTAAQADYEKAIELDETLEVAYIGLANSFICQGNYDDALSVLQKSVQSQKVAEMIQNINQLLNSVKATPEKENRITVLEKQSVIRYDRVNDSPGLIHDEIVYTNYLYQYNDQGYLVYRGSATRTDEESEWKESPIFDEWSYNPETGKWTETSRHVNRGGVGLDSDITSKELESYSPSSRSYATGQEAAVCITFDPYPAGTPSKVYNSEYGSIDGADRVDWYSANYTYDEDGNAIFVESYSKDGQLLGTCEIEWKTIELSENPEGSK